MVDVIVVGGGPIGLACAIELQRLRRSVLVLEGRSVAESVRRFPLNMTFFSTSDLIELANMPLVSQGPRPTRFEALKYYNRITDALELNVCRYTEVVAIEPANGGFRAISEEGQHFDARRVVIATGYYRHPNFINVPGEELPHVKHYYDEAIPYSKMKVLVVGGQNSACDTALDLYRAGANVSLVHRKKTLGASVKYWIRPDIENRIRNGEIAARFSCEVSAITKQTVTIRNIESGEYQELPADFVFLMTGYHPDTALLRAAGIAVDRESIIPKHAAGTFETNVPGIYVAGSITAGKRTSDIFIENGRHHAKVIAEHIAGALDKS